MIRSSIDLDINDCFNYISRKENKVFTKKDSKFKIRDEGTPVFFFFREITGILFFIYIFLRVYNIPKTNILKRPELRLISHSIRLTA